MSSRRRRLPPPPRTQGKGVFLNLLGMLVILTLIISYQCDDKPRSSSWMDALITPPELRLPKSVTDRR